MKVMKLLQTPCSNNHTGIHKIQTHIVFILLGKLGLENPQNNLLKDSEFPAYIRYVNEHAVMQEYLKVY